MRTIRFCSVVFGVKSSLAVINTIRGRPWLCIVRERALSSRAVEPRRQWLVIARGACWSNTCIPVLYDQRYKCHNLPWSTAGRVDNNWPVAALTAGIVRNSLPTELRSPDISLDVFKAKLKTFLFNCWLSGFGVFIRASVSSDLKALYKSVIIIIIIIIILILRFTNVLNNNNNNNNNNWSHT